MVLIELRGWKLHLETSWLAVSTYDSRGGAVVDFSGF